MGNYKIDRNEVGGAHLRERGYRIGRVTVLRR